MTTQHLPQEPLRVAVADLVFERHSPGELDNAMIEKRHARFKRNRHRRAIQFHQNVVGQIGNGVRRHHLLEGVEVAKERRRGCHQRRRLRDPDDQRVRLRPLRNDAAVKLHERAAGEKRRPLVDLGARVANMREPRQCRRSRVPQRWRHCPERSCGRRTQRPRNQAQPPPQCRRQSIAVVAAEQLVARISR